MAKNTTANVAAAPMIDLIKRMQDANFPQMPVAGLGWVEAMSDLGAQMLTFMAERVRQDVKTQHDLLHAKGIAEVQHIQAQFFQRAMNDYIDEMAKLTELGKQQPSGTATNPAASKP